MNEWTQDLRWVQLRCQVMQTDGWLQNGYVSHTGLSDLMELKPSFSQLLKRLLCWQLTAESLSKKEHDLTHWSLLPPCGQPEYSPVTLASVWDHSQWPSQVQMSGECSVTVASQLSLFLSPVLLLALHIHPPLGSVSSEPPTLSSKSPSVFPRNPTKNKNYDPKFLLKAHHISVSAQLCLYKEGELY